MPLQDHMKLISTDDHVVEHPRVWLDRLPAGLRERGPRLVEVTEDMVRSGLSVPSKGGSPVPVGAEVWLLDGEVHPTIATNAIAGRPREEYGFEPFRLDQVRPGCYDPIARVADMDLDGVQAQLCFPSFPRFAGTLFIDVKDKELALACVRAYNDFMIDEWCAAAPDRYIPLVILPLWDITASKLELERTIGKGAKAVAFPEGLTPLGLPSIYTGQWDPVFAVAEAASVPLCMHFGTSGSVPVASAESPPPVWISLMGCNSMSTCSDLLFSPVFHKFPGLKVALSEGGIGWIPWLLERMDYVWDHHRMWTDIDKTTPPSVMFRDHIYGCFIDDLVGLELRHQIGVSQITWEGDYPHSDSTWPEGRKRAAEVLADIPDDEVHQMVELNARRLFSFTADLTVPTPA
jgi:predicted TIM-barrel fold metal-dependent hydrolase